MKTYLSRFIPHPVKTFTPKNCRHIKVKWLGNNCLTLRAGAPIGKGMKTNWTVTLLGLAIVVSGCAKKGVSTDALNAAPSSSGNYLYVASGACYGGGVTTSNPSYTVAKYNLADGSFNSLVVDYNSFSPGDIPMGVVDYNSTEILVLIENPAGRRIDVVEKAGNNAVSTYLTNSTALNSVMRGMFRLANGCLLVSKTTAIEDFASSKARILQGANPYVSAPAGSCATSTTLISSVAALPNGKIIYAHAGATPNNKFGVISSTGYASASDCLGAQTAPNTLALPTSVVVHEDGTTLFVGYGSTTAASNAVYSYTVNPTTGAITNPVAAFTDFTVVNGISAMAEDPSTGNVYVANATNTANTIEQFTSSNGVLTRVGSAPFIPSTVYSRCVSSMMISSE
jgi:hypothetical protein